MAGMGPRKMLRGLREAIVDPIRRDIANAEELAYRARKANPGVDSVLSLIPHYGATAAIQDASRAQTGTDAAVDMAGALPVIRAAKGLRAAAGGLAKQGAKGRRAANNLYAAGAAGAGLIAADKVGDFQDARPFTTEGLPYAR